MIPFYLLDTSVVSHLAPGRAGLPARVVEWFEEREAISYLSVITVLELERGVAKLIRHGHSAKAMAISEWIANLTDQYSSRTIEVNGDIARCAGRLEDMVVGRGYSPGVADAIIAATAIMNNGVVLTRNLRHFRRFDVKCFDPFLLET